MKVLKNTYSFRNVIIYMLLSVIFLISIHALSIGDTLISRAFLILTLNENSLTLLAVFGAVFAIFTYKKRSQWLMLIAIICVTLKSFVFLSQTFNKLILVMNFIYILFSFYFFTIWELFNLKASQNPKFSENDLEKESRHQLRGRIILATEEKIPFWLTNIDEEGCFVLLDNMSIGRVKLSDRVEIEVELEGVKFASEAICVSTYDRGLGFIFDKNRVNLRSLSGLYQVCLDRGLIN